MIKILPKQRGTIIPFIMAFLISALIIPQNLFAQSNAEQIIKRYEKGELINFSPSGLPLSPEIFNGGVTT